MIRMAYIDSEMAKGRQAHSHHKSLKTSMLLDHRPNKSSRVDYTRQHHSHSLKHTSSPKLTSAPFPPPPTKLPPPNHGPIKQPPRKPRLGRDGKPLRRPRPPKRRNSEDLARDALVEQVLHEHRLENVYQPPSHAPKQALSSSQLSEAQPADASRDEDFAERFRQDFLDQVAERKQAQQQKKTAAAGAAVEKTQGPKLGGSRAARARMAATQQQQGGGSAQK